MRIGYKVSKFIRQVSSALELPRSLVSHPIRTLSEDVFQLSSEAKEFGQLSKIKAFKDAMNHPISLRCERPRKPLNTHGKKVLYAYSTEYFKGLNPYLRDEDISLHRGIYGTTPEDLMRMEKLLNGALNGDAVKLHQGISMRWQPKGFFDGYKQGQTFIEQGFFSTGADFRGIDQFRSDLYYSRRRKYPELVIVNGKSGRNISDFSMRSYEHEVLFPSKTPFQVTKRQHIGSIEDVPEELKMLMLKDGNLEFEPFNIIYLKER